MQQDRCHRFFGQELTNDGPAKVLFDTTENKQNAIDRWGKNKLTTVIGLKRTTAGIPDHWIAVLTGNSDKMQRLATLKKWRCNSLLKIWSKALHILPR